MNVSKRFAIKSGLTAASLAMVSLLALLPASPARADTGVAPASLPEMLVRIAEPNDVRSSISAVRAACASWPKASYVPQTVHQPRGADLSAGKDKDVCDFVDDPDSLVRSASLPAVAFTIVSFVIAAAVLGFMRLNLVIAWSWRRPRRNVMPWS